MDLHAERGKVSSQNVNKNCEYYLLWHVSVPIHLTNVFSTNHYVPTNCLNVYSQLLKQHVFTASESSRQTGSSCCHRREEPFLLMPLLEAIWNSVAKAATEEKLFLHAMCFRTSPMLWLHGWAALPPRYFHITTAELIVDRCKTERAEIWKNQIKMEFCGSVSEVGMLASVRICSALEYDWSVYQT